jgi:hypothetical protein
VHLAVDSCRAARRVQLRQWTFLAHRWRVQIVTLCSTDRGAAAAACLAKPGLKFKCKSEPKLPDTRRKSQSTPKRTGELRFASLPVDYRLPLRHSLYQGCQDDKQYPSKGLRECFKCAAHPLLVGSLLNGRVGAWSGNGWGFCDLILP